VKNFVPRKKQDLRLDHSFGLRERETYTPTTMTMSLLLYVTRKDKLLKIQVKPVSTNKLKTAAVDSAAFSALR